MINLRQNKAFALTFTLIFMFLVVSFTAVYILSVANGISQANRIANIKRAYYIADAGLADAYERIYQAGINTVASSTCVNPNIPSTCTAPYIPSANTDNGVYSVDTTTGNYTISVIYSNVPRNNYTITSTGTYGKISKTLQLKIISTAISSFSYWSQTEINPAFGGPLYWVGMPGIQMISDGPIHTNGQLNIYMNPKFNSLVTESNLPILADGSLGTTPTSTSPNYYYGIGPSPGSDPAKIFKGGLQNDVPPDNLALQTTINAVQTAANSSGLVLTGASTVIFNSTGTITVTGTVKNAQGAVTATYNNTTMSAPANGVIYVQSNSGKQDGNATVQGTVKGQLTVAADQNIYLGGSVGYNTDPRSSNSNDLLGLIANQNITIIAANSPSALEVSGVLVTVHGSFQVDQYWAPKGNAQTSILDQFGSLINYTIGATGEMDSSGNLLGGYNQIQHKDSRLATTAPPGFPAYYLANGGLLYTKVSFSEL